MRVDRDRAQAAFSAYVAAYDPADPKIALKVDHTWRVAALAERIARAAGMPADDVDLAWLCGLLHDVGRFEQVRRYGTFNDARSVSHARLGEQVLFDEGRLRDYLPDAFGAPEAPAEPDASAADPAADPAPLSPEAALVRTAVATHSDFRLPAGLPARTRALCDVLRDADKVDILKAISESDMAEVLDVTPGQIRQSPLSPAVVEAFYAHRTVRRDERAWPADYLASYACFVFELVYPESVRIAHEQGFAQGLLRLPFERADTSGQFAAMAAHLDAWFCPQGEGTGPDVAPHG